MPRFVPEDWKDLPRGTIFEVLDLTEKDVPWFVGTVLVPESAPGWGYRIGVSSQYILTPGHWGLCIRNDGTLGWVDLDTLKAPPVEVRFFDDRGDGTPLQPWEVRPGHILEVHYGQASNTLEVWVELGPELDDQGVPIEDEEEDDPATIPWVPDTTKDHCIIDPTGRQPSTPWAVAYLQVRPEFLALLKRWEKEDDDAPLDLFRLGFRMGEAQGMKTALKPLR